MKEKMFIILIISVIRTEYHFFDCANQHAFISFLISDEKNRKEGSKKGRRRQHRWNTNLYTFSIWFVYANQYGLYMLTNMLCICKPIC